MARRVRDTDLESRAARGKLKRSGKPYFKTIGAGLHVGYRKGATEGKWVVRHYVGDQTYVVETIAAADDIEDANGSSILTFWQAQDRARERAGSTHSGPYRVRDCVRDYRKTLEGRSAAYDGGIRLEKHVLPQLGDELVEKLTAERLRNWHRDLSLSLPIIPKKKDGVRKAVNLDDPEVIRRRQVSANRVFTILRAALNHAFRDGKVASDAQWRRVRPFKDVERSRASYLTLEQCSALLAACEGDFGSLVRGALETGARYGELCRLRCGNYNADSGTIYIGQSKSGHARHIVLTVDGQNFFSGLVADRDAAEPMFGREWHGSDQWREMRELCERAGIAPVNFHQLRHTWASHAVMGGVPLMVVAKNLGHADTRMIEKHYGHLAQSYMTDAIRNHAPKFGVAVR
jgi:integrase